MRRIALGLAGAVAIAAAAATFSILRAPLDGAGDRLVAELREATGLTARANGEAELRLLPSPRIRIAGVSLSHGADTPFAIARSLSGRLSLVDLLFGRLELAEVTLEQPQVVLDRLPFADVMAALKAHSGSAPPTVRMSGARLTWRGQTVDKVEAGLVWPGGGAFTLSGYGRYAGRPVQATVQLADLAAFERREAAPFRARIEGGGARVLFDGEAVDVDGPKFVGDVSFRADGLSDTLQWLGARARAGGALASGISFAGQGQLDADGLQVSNAELELGGKTYLGAGRLTSGTEGLAVEATLDADTVDLGPYFELFAPQAIRADGSWSEDPISLAALRGWTLDLRLSADEMLIGGFRLDQPAVTAVVAKGGLDLSVGAASAYGGTMGGRLSLEPDGDSARMRLEGGATDVGLGDALEATLGRRPIAGALTAETSMESRGGSVAELVSGLSGRLTARLDDGAIERISRSRTLAIAGFSGRMEVSRADAEMTLTRGVAHADPVSVNGPRGAFALSGVASLIDRTVALSGFVRPSEGGWTLPVRIDGPLFTPRLRPDLTGKPPRGEARRGP